MEVRPFIDRTEAHVLNQSEATHALALAAYAGVMAVFHSVPNPDRLMASFEAAAEGVEGGGLATGSSEEALAETTRLIEQLRTALSAAR